MLLNRIIRNRVTPNETGPRFFQVPMRQAGVIVDHDRALQASAVYACVRVIAEDIASLPWHVFTRLPNGGRERQPTSPVEMVLNRRPNPDLSSFAFRETMVAWALTWGNAYAEIDRDLAGRVAALYLISPDRVEVKRDGNGKVIYEISNARQSNSFLGPRDVFHLKGLGFDGVSGYSLVSLAAKSIGLSISAEEFGAQFFGNGAQLGGLLKVPPGSTMTPEAKKNLKATFNREHKGPGKAHKVELLDAGIEYEEIGIEPEKGQFIESRQHQVEEICRWFRVSPQKVAHLLRMTFNNVEQLSIDHVQDTLVPWITRLEQEADYKLFGNQNNTQYTKIATNALLRGDSAARSTFYREMWNLGVLSVNEIREFEDMNPVTHGDKRFVQLNMTTLDKAGEAPEVVEPEEDPEDSVEDPEDNIEDALRLDISRVQGCKSNYETADDFVEWVEGHGGELSIQSALKRVNSIDTELFKDVYREGIRAMRFSVYHGEKVDTKAIAANLRKDYERIRDKS